MGLRFCLGGSGSGKSTTIYQEIIQRSMEHPEEDFLVIVPDQFTMQTQKELCGLHPRGGIMNIDVLSFSRLAHRIFDEVYVEDKTVLDDTGKNLVIRSVAAKKLDQLKVIGGQLKKAGYVHEVKSVISEFMQYDIQLADLHQMIEYGSSHGQLKAKLKDLAVLYEGFLDFIKDTYVTTEETLDILRGVLARSSLIRRSTVVIDGFTGFTPVQNKLLAEILRLSRDVIVVLVLDPRENPYVCDGAHKLFYLTKKTIASLTKLADEVSSPLREDTIIREPVVRRYQDNEELAHLERNLFRYGFKPFEKKTKHIHLFAARNPKQEAQKVCLSIRRLLREEDYCFRDIAVVTGAPREYAGVMAEECKRYGIPYFLDQNLGLMFHPMIHAILGAMEVLRYGFSYDSVFHYLRSGLNDLTFDEIDALDGYVRSLGIRGQKSYENPFVRRPAGIKDEEFASLLAKLNPMREKLMNGLRPLLVLEGENSGTAYVDAVYEFCVAGRLQAKLEEYAVQFEKEGESARAKEYRQVYRVIMDLLHQIHELLGAQRVSLGDFTEILAAGFSELKVSTIPPEVDQIVIGDIERTRLKKIKALFFIGVNDGTIPKGGTGGGLISDLDREFLAEGGYEMAPARREQMFTQKLYLYMNMTKPTQNLFLSYCGTDRAGKALRPSYLIEEMRRLFPLLETETMKESEIASCVETKQDGYDDLAGLLCSYAAGTLNKDQEELSDFFDIIKLYCEDEKVLAMVHAAFMEYRPDPLSVMTAKAIYGDVIRGSVSRLEQYAGCSFAHFVKYGLQLSPDEQFSFESVDMGTIFHDMLARFCAFLNERGESLLTFQREVMEEFTEKTLEEVAVQYGGTVLYSSARNAYMIRRMERILKRTFLALQYQLKKGQFEPAHFEVPFEITKKLLSDSESRMRMIGRIDRIDKVMRDGNTYLKIMDYKSGNSQFDPVSLYYGTQLQLAVYLHAAMLMENKEHRGKDGKVIPAAILYYHVQDPFVKREKGKESDEALEAERMEALRMDGMVNAQEECIRLLDSSFGEHSDVIPVDRKKSGGYTAASKVADTSSFEVLSDFAGQKMAELGTEIAQGRIEVDPYERGGKNACTYCEFSSICKYDEKIPGYHMRKLDTMTWEEAMEKMAKAVIDRTDQEISTGE